MERLIFDADHRAFRDTVKRFVAREMTPRVREWEDSGVVTRDVWAAAGQAGLLAPDIALEYGGGGVDDYRYHVIRDEELASAGLLSPAFNLHSEVVGGYFRALATPEQKRRWLPGFCSGDRIGTVAITEPDAGSDVSAIRTVARPEADAYILSGQKAFVTHGSIADYIVVAARSAASPDDEAGPPRAVLLVVCPDMPGVVRGRPQPKIGLHSLDTIEIFFDSVVVPCSHRLGEDGLAFLYLLQNLPRERLSIAVSALALAEQVFADTVRYCRQRRAFGGALRELQTVRFSLAEMATALTVARSFTDRCIVEHNEGSLSVEEASMAKWWNTELCAEVTDRCLQLHGGYGYTTELPVGRAFVNCRVQRIYGGTTEIMKEIIGQAVAG
jgi:alkylation response protein AidB-like acyl-CoA dehydrogenase